MQNEQHSSVDTDTLSTADQTELLVTDESILLKNYDSTATHTMTVRLQDPGESVAFKQTYELCPDTAVSIQLRLRRAIYTVEAWYKDASASSGGTEDSESVLIGSAPDETALIELGNGLISVTEGIL